MRRVGLLIGCAVLVTSCGGGGTTVVNPVSTFRTNFPGDSWLYDVQISFGKFGAYTGTLSISLSNDTYNGSPSIKQTQDFFLNLQTGPSNVISYSEYSPSGKLLAQTINTVLTAVTSDTFAVPSPLKVGASSSGTVTFADGSSTDLTYQVVDKQPASTPGGSYSCWVVDQTSHKSDTTSDTYRMWIAPETGNYVRLTDTTVNPDGSGYTYTATLNSSVTVPGPSRPLGEPSSFLAQAVQRLALQLPR